MLSPVNFIFIAVLTGLLYLYFNPRFNYWKSRGVPFKKPNFLFGNILDLGSWKETPGKAIGRLHDQFEDPYFGIYCFTRPFLFIKDLDIIKRVLIKDFPAFPNRFFFSDEKIDAISSTSLFGIRDGQWKVLRSKLSPVFTSGNIKTMMHLMKQCGNNLERYLESNSVLNVEMKEVAAKYTTDVIATCAFGINASSFEDENSGFRVAGRKIFKQSVLSLLQALAYFCVPTVAKLLKFKFIDPSAVQFLRKVFEEEIRQREVTKVKRNDLVDILIDLKNEETKDDEFKFYGERLLAQAVVFFAAGLETTSSTIAFTLHEFCIHTDIQDKVRKEIMEVITEHGDITYEAIQKMKYLQMAVSETLRKYPLTPFISRECAEDYKIPETGLIIEKGTPIIISQHGLHWDPKYFPNPEKYDPERFSDENKGKIPACTYVPFGEGPRGCIGDRFALISCKLGLIYILKDFKVERSPITREPLVFGRHALLIAKGGVQMKLTKVE